MANANLGVVIDVVDKRQTQGLGTSAITTPANYDDVTALRTRLAAISGTAYSAANLDAMTKNDMVYALRLNDDTAGI